MHISRELQSWTRRVQWLLLFALQFVHFGSLLWDVGGFPPRFFALDWLWAVDGQFA